MYPIILKLNISCERAFKMLLCQTLSVRLFSEPDLCNFLSTNYVLRLRRVPSYRSLIFFLCQCLIDVCWSRIFVSWRGTQFFAEKKRKLVKSRLIVSVCRRSDETLINEESFVIKEESSISFCASAGCLFKTLLERSSR